VIVFRTWKISPRSLWNPLAKVRFDVVPLGQTTLPSDVNTPLGGSNCSATVNVTLCGGPATAAGTAAMATAIAAARMKRRTQASFSCRRRAYAAAPRQTTSADDGRQHELAVGPALGG